MPVEIYLFECLLKKNQTIIHNSMAGLYKGSFISLKSAKQGLKMLPSPPTNVISKMHKKKCQYIFLINAALMLLTCDLITWDTKWC